ncbi:MAG: hypothetical protein IJT85_03790 [Ruminococcus sp.]|nr:hypothetical protein [Ruminococcus sp.]
MKTKIKRHSRAVISVILAISMLVSCMMVGLIATDAAKVTGDEAVGVGALTFRYKLGDGTWSDLSVSQTSGSYGSNTFTVDSSGTLYCWFKESNGNYYGNQQFTAPSSEGDYKSLAQMNGISDSNYQTNTNNVNKVTLSSSGTYTVKVNFSENKFTIFGGSGSSGGSDPSKGTAPAAVVSGTDIMFYIESYDGTNIKLGDADYNDSPGTFTNLVAGKSYVQVTKSTAGNYQYITNNPTSTSWAGVENTSIGTGSAGSYYVGNGTVDHTDAKTAATTLSPSSIYTGTSSITLSTTCNSATGVYDSLQLYTQYYLDGTYVTGSETTASTSAKSFTLNTSSLSAGSHTLKTILTDGNIFYIADTDTLTVTAETKYTVNISAGTGGSVSPNGDQSVGVDTGLSVEATPSTGYSFSSWTKTNVTTSTETAETTVKPTNSDVTHSLVANFSKNSYTLTKGAESHGTFTVSAGGDTITTSGSVLYNDTITVSCTPAAGYTVSTVSAGSNTGTEGSNNVWTVNMPAADATLNVTFAANDNAITTSADPTQGGNVWVGEASNTTYENRNTTYKTDSTVYLRASINDGYNFSKFVVTYADSYTQEITDATVSGTSVYKALTLDATHFSGDNGAISVVGYFTKKPTYKITVKSNDTSLGSVTASPAEAYSGQTVTITAVENTGTFSKMSFTGIDKPDVNTKTTTFTMPGNAVTVNATFTEYSAQSNFYYNSYGSDGQPAATHYGARMTEAKLNGETYSYYHVTGRNETDQLFTVSYGDPAHNGTVYFVTPDGWTDKHGWDATTIDAQFYGSDGELIATWANMTSDNYYGSDRCFKITIPSGARKVQFRAEKNDPDTSNWPATALFDLNALAEHVDCIYISEYSKNSSGQFDKLGAKNRGNTSKPIADGFFENFNGTNKYTNAFNSGGFNGHNASRGASHAYTKPDNLDESQRGDYYVLVLYKGKTYTINGVTKTITNDPEIIWLPELPDNSDKAIIYAKDGALRSGSQTFANHATTVATSGGTTGTRKDNDYSLLKLEKDGSTVTVTTTIDAGDWRSKYYVKGFNINGVTPKLYEYNSDGTYSVTFTLGEDNISFDGGEVDYINDRYVEITPIYYLKDSPNSVTFYIRGFDDTVKASWGDTIAAYPFYNGAGGTECAFGGYPGQPLINYGGKLFIDVPLSVTNSSNEVCTIQGITMSNNYWDRIHGTTQNEGNLLHVKAVTTHAQTYDYDDFSKIFTEVKEQNKSPETIVFDFKYRTAQNNEKSATLGSTDSYANGWDDVVNAQGALVDIFGNELSDTDKAKSPIYVVSDGYWNNYSGAYSTEWHVYQNNGTFIGTINPSVRWVQSADRLSETVYPYGGKAEYLSIYHKLSSFADEYTALQTYKNTPVKITFEEEIRNESGQSGWDGYNHNSNASDKAKRSDGLWMYSFNGTKINANTVIEYSDDDGETYTEDPYNTGTNTSTLGMKAYFTNSEFNGETSVETRSNNEDFFKFTAESAGEYIFVGWYNKEMDGSTAKYLRISTAVNGQSSMESGGTFVARFIKNPSGQLTLSHTILKDATYQGDGTATIKVEVKDAENTVVKTYNGITTGESEFTIPNTYIKYNHGYTLTVTLNTVPKGDDTFAQFTTSVNSKFYNNATESTGTNPATSVFSFDVDDLFEYDSENDHYNQTTKVLRYYSQLNQIQYTYAITYNFKSYRENKGNMSYKVTGTFTESDIASYLNKSDKVKDADNNNAYVTAYALDDDNKRAAFINKYGPYENNFLTNITWNTATSGTGCMSAKYHGNSKRYDIDVNASTTQNSQITLELFLPYAHDSQEENNYEPTYVDGKCNQDLTTEPIVHDNLDQMKWYATNHAKTYYDDDPPTFVTAPQVIYNGNNPLVFRYWKVSKPESETNSERVEYTRCFAREFNLSLYQDSYVEPYFSAPTEAEINSGQYASPHDNAIASGMGATITFMENSRNQYNNGGVTLESIESRKARGDRVFTDFLISFANPQDTQYATYANGTYYAGIVVERVALLDKNQKGDYYTLTEEQYKAKYGSEVDADKLTDIEAFIENTGTYASSGTVYRDGNEIYDTNASGVIKYQKSQVDANTLDNKNRMDFYYSISARNHTSDFAYNHNADYVYRAYSYIKDNSGNVVMLSPDPLYFTIYDMASIANAADGETYDNRPKS